jgi:MoaD family protein
MSVKVSIPTILRTYTNNARSVEASGETLGAVIADLEAQFSGIGDRLLENGQLRRFVNIYVNDEDVRFTGSLATELSDGDNVTILPAVAGG